MSPEGFLKVWPIHSHFRHLIWVFIWPQRVVHQNFSLLIVSRHLTLHLRRHLFTKLLLYYNKSFVNTSFWKKNVDNEILFRCWRFFFKTCILQQIEYPKFAISFLTHSPSNETDVVLQTRPVSIRFATYFCTTLHITKGCYKSNNEYL